MQKACTGMEMLCCGYLGSLNQEDQGYSPLALNQKEEKKIVDGMAHTTQRAPTLIAFDEPCLVINIIPSFDVPCWTFALRLPYGMPTLPSFLREGPAIQPVSSLF